MCQIHCGFGPTPLRFEATTFIIGAHAAGCCFDVGPLLAGETEIDVAPTYSGMSTLAHVIPFETILVQVAHFHHKSTGLGLET